MSDERYYSRDNTWVCFDGEEAIVGLTAKAAEELGELTYLELPEVGTDFILGDSLGIAESLEKSTNVLSPVSGTVIQVNENLDDDPGLVNQSPEGKGWICRLENIDLTEMDDLMDEEAYREYLKNS